MAPPQRIPIEDIIGNVQRPIDTTNIISTTHTIWSSVVSNKGKIDLTPVQATIEDENDRFLIIKAIIEHLLPGVSEEEQKVIESFINDLLPSVINSFELIYEKMKKKQIGHKLKRFSRKLVYHLKRLFTCAPCKENKMTMAPHSTTPLTSGTL